MKCETCWKNEGTDNYEDKIVCERCLRRYRMYCNTEGI